MTAITHLVPGILHATNSPTQSLRQHLYVLKNIYFYKYNPKPKATNCTLQEVINCRRMLLVIYMDLMVIAGYNLSYYLYCIIFVLMKVKPKAIVFLRVTVIYLSWL